MDWIEEYARDLYWQPGDRTLATTVPLSKGYTLRIALDYYDGVVSLGMIAYWGEWHLSLWNREGEARGPGGLEVYRAMSDRFEEIVETAFRSFPKAREVIFGHGSDRLYEAYRAFLYRKGLMCPEGPVRYLNRWQEFSIERWSWMRWRGNA